MILENKRFRFMFELFTLLKLFPILGCLPIMQSIEFPKDKPKQLLLDMVVDR